MIRFDASLFYAAMLAASKEQTRYYLLGVNVERHPVSGVILTATDGHMLVSIYDAGGECDQTRIVELSVEALKACKPSKHERREVHIEGNTARVVEVADNSEGVAEVVRTVAITEKCFIDGKFPDWRRVVPTIGDHEGYATFGVGLLARFAKIAEALSLGVRSPTIRVVSSAVTSPAMVLFQNANAFGVLMPVRGDADTPVLPAWVNEPAKSVAA